MKKLNLIIVLLLTIVVTACQHRHQKTIIVHQSNNNYTKLECSGSVSVSDDRTQIKSISPGGYVDYRHNSEDIRATADNDGKISYKLNGIEITNIDGAAKSLLTEAVIAIAESKSH